MQQLFTLFILVLMLLTSCSKDKISYQLQVPSGCDSLTLIYSYNRDIKPIIGTNCAGSTCHTEGSGNYDFSIYEVFADRVRNGQVNYRLLLPLSDPQHMPQTGPPGYKGRSLNP